MLPLPVSLDFLCLDATTPPGFSGETFLFKDWTVIEISKVLALADECLAVLRDLANNLTTQQGK